jgi:hypothetical protein
VQTMTVDTHSLNIANDQAVLERFKLNPLFWFVYFGSFVYFKTAENQN